MTDRQKRIRRRKQIRKAKKMLRRMLLWVGVHPILTALPLIIFMAMLAADMAAFSAKMERRKQDHGNMITMETQAKQNEAETTQTEAPAQQLTTMDIYGCESLTGAYGDPWGAMSQDWSGEDVEGFYYHEISEECKAAGGAFPVIAQIYTYIVCNNYGVDYEMVFALIEHESKCRWDAAGDGGTSIGLMQVSEKWHADRMERLNRSNLQDPYTNILIGVDFIAEIQGRYKGTVSEEELPYYVLAVYNYGEAGAKRHLWDQGIVEYSYSRGIMQRAEQLKEEKHQAQIRAQEKEGGKEA